VWTIRNTIYKDSFCTSQKTQYISILYSNPPPHGVANVWCLPCCISHPRGEALFSVESLSKSAATYPSIVDARLYRTSAPLSPCDLCRQVYVFQPQKPLTFVRFTDTFSFQPFLSLFSAHPSVFSPPPPPTSCLTVPNIEFNPSAPEFMGTSYSEPLLWSSGQSSWLQNGHVLCFLWGTNWIYICYVEESRPPLWPSGQSSWLQIQRSRVRFPALPNFLRSNGSVTASTQPREDNWGATWKEK
jgi:hypothetical protein